MKVYTLRFTTLLPCSIDEAWEFFSTPLNLNRITPPDMSFEILSEVDGVKMYPGMVIHYRVRPLLQIPLRWTTEITHCVDKKYFVDEQRFGPYAFWHHQHHFEEVSGGVQMTDTINYAIGMGPLGSMANALYVGKRLEEIFTYREKVVGDIFGK
ncbi:MAG: SRPBCC family protein [Flavobacteriales bacterium]|jgi:ligand-binding SRPBCC domain-containing protein